MKLYDSRAELWLKIQPFKSDGIFIKMRGDKYILVGNLKAKQDSLLKQGFKFDEKIKAWILPPVPAEQSIYKSLGKLLGSPVDMRRYSKMLDLHKQRKLRPMRADRSVELLYKQRVIELISKIKDTTVKRASEFYGSLTDANFASRIMSEFNVISTKYDLEKVSNMIAEESMNKAERVNRERFVSRINEAMGVDLSKILTKTAVGKLVAEKIKENGFLIRTIPEDMIDRLQKTISGNWQQGRRWEEITEALSHDYEISEGRARTLSRTETAKMNSALTEARSRDVGITGYIWHGALDNRERDSHFEMEGQYVDYDNPPELDGMVGHAGEFPNCRCWQEPVIIKQTEDPVVEDADVPLDNEDTRNDYGGIGVSTAAEIKKLTIE